jgi:hypothetical protein
MVFEQPIFGPDPPLIIMSRQRAADGYCFLCAFVETAPKKAPNSSRSLKSDRQIR